MRAIGKYFVILVRSGFQLDQGNLSTPVVAVLLNIICKEKFKLVHDGGSGRRIPKQILIIQFRNLVVITHFEVLKAIYVPEKT